MEDFPSPYGQRLYLVNRAFFDVVNPLLYGELNPRNPKSMFAFVKCCERHGQLLRRHERIKKLTLSTPNQSPSPQTLARVARVLASGPPTTADLATFVCTSNGYESVGHGRSKYLVDVLSLCPNLRRVCLTGDYMSRATRLNIDIFLRMMGEHHPSYASEVLRNVTLELEDVEQLRGILCQARVGSPRFGRILLLTPA